MSQSFELPLGVIHNGGVDKTCVLKPMTAKTRRLIANKANQRNPVAGITDLLVQCCEQLGTSPATPQIANSLTVGDRDFMLLMLRVISLGNILKAQTTCARCGEDLSFDLPLDQIKIVRPVLDKDFRIEGGFAYTTVESPELGIKVEMRYPTGHDQSAISNQLKTDPVGATYSLYARLLRVWEKNGKLIENPNSLEFIDDLPLAEIEWLEQAIMKASPGPEWRVNLNCEVCHKQTPLDLSDTDFLFKTPR